MHTQTKKHALAALCCAAAIGLLTGCSHKEPEVHTTVSDSSMGDQVEEASNSEAKASTGIVNFDMPEVGEDIVVLTIKDYGDVKIRLFPDETEKGAENFRKLVESGYYDGLIFHRVIDHFMIQGGDPLGIGIGGDDAWGGSGFEQTLSPNLCHVTGAVAYAISRDKLNKSQFYIVTGDEASDEMFDTYAAYGYTFSDAVKALYKGIGGAPHLDGGYEIFGQVFDGMEYVLEIQSTETDDSDKPVKDVVIEKAVVVPYDGAAPHFLTYDGKEYQP